MGNSPSRNQENPEVSNSFITLFKNIDKLNQALKECNIDEPPVIQAKIGGENYKITFENFNKSEPQASKDVVITKVREEPKSATASKYINEHNFQYKQRTPSYLCQGNDNIYDQYQESIECQQFQYNNCELDPHKQNDNFGREVGQFTKYQNYSGPSFNGRQQSNNYIHKNQEYGSNQQYFMNKQDQQQQAQPLKNLDLNQAEYYQNASQLQYDFNSPKNVINYYTSPRCSDQKSNQFQLWKQNQQLSNQKANDYQQMNFQNYQQHQNIPSATLIPGLNKRETVQKNNNNKENTQQRFYHKKTYSTIPYISKETNHIMHKGQNNLNVPSSLSSQQNSQSTMFNTQQTASNIKNNKSPSINSFSNNINGYGNYNTNSRSKNSSFHYYTSILTNSNSSHQSIITTPKGIPQLDENSFNNNPQQIHYHSRTPTKTYNYSVKEVQIEQTSPKFFTSSINEQNQNVTNKHNTSKNQLRYNSINQDQTQANEQSRKVNSPNEELITFEDIFSKQILTNQSQTNNQSKSNYDQYKGNEKQINNSNNANSYRQQRSTTTINTNTTQQSNKNKVQDLINNITNGLQKLSLKPQQQQESSLNLKCKNQIENYESSTSSILSTICANICKEQQSLQENKQQKQQQGTVDNFEIYNNLAQFGLQSQSEASQYSAIWTTKNKENINNDDKIKNPNKQIQITTDKEKDDSKNKEMEIRVSMCENGKINIRQSFQKENNTIPLLNFQEQLKEEFEHSERSRREIKQKNKNTFLKPKLAGFNDYIQQSQEYSKPLCLETPLSEQEYQQCEDTDLNISEETPCQQNNYFSSPAQFLNQQVYPSGKKQNQNTEESENGVDYYSDLMNQQQLYHSESIKSVRKSKNNTSLQLQDPQSNSFKNGLEDCDDVLMANDSPQQEKIRILENKFKQQKQQEQVQILRKQQTFQEKQKQNELELKLLEKQLLEDKQNKKKNSNQLKFQPIEIELKKQNDSINKIITSHSSVNVEDLQQKAESIIYETREKILNDIKTEINSRWQQILEQKKSGEQLVSIESKKEEPQIYTAHMYQNQITNNDELKDENNENNISGVNLTTSILMSPQVSNNFLKPATNKLKSILTSTNKSKNQSKNNSMSISHKKVAFKIDEQHEEEKQKQKSQQQSGHFYLSHSRRNASSPSINLTPRQLSTGNL